MSASVREPHEAIGGALAYWDFKGGTMNLAHILLQSAPLYGDKALFRYNGTDYEFDAIQTQIHQLAHALRMRGVQRGDRVLLLAKNKPEWVVAMLGSLAVGAIVVPVNPALTAAELGYIVEHSEPSLVFVDTDLLASIEQCVPERLRAVFGDEQPDSFDLLLAQGIPQAEFAECEPQEPAVIFYTSGTTGRPKGVLLSHEALSAITEISGGNFQIRPDDKSIIPNSLSFIYPLMINCCACIRAGATIVLQDRFHPELVLRTIESERITIFMGVPTMYTMMLNWALGKDVDASSLRYCVAAGSSLSWNVVQQMQQTFGVTLYDLWGQTEGTPITSYDPATERQGRRDSCGRALPGCAVRIVDEDDRELPHGEVGEVLLKGPNVMLGYYKNLQATQETLRDGWVYTGDLGRLDADGYLYIVGRKRDMIIRGGANVYPVEIEETLYQHPAVLECAVVGTPDELYGETIKACIVTREAHQASAEELQDHCRQLLAEYKVPSAVAFMDELPKGPTGKILKRLLRV
ncbi:AMP-binding protein [Alcaligenaceae bacterium CGII-47]|nr:AMP-binding protein [Alcaligenaceae bacterium CGII-47]